MFLLHQRLFFGGEIFSESHKGRCAERMKPNLIDSNWFLFMQLLIFGNSN